MGMAAMAASMTGYSSTSAYGAPEATVPADDGTKASTMRCKIRSSLSFIPGIKTSEGEAIISG